MAINFGVPKIVQNPLILSANPGVSVGGRVSHRVHMIVIIIYIIY